MSAGFLCYLQPRRVPRLEMDVLPVTQLRLWKTVDGVPDGLGSRQVFGQS